MWVYMHRTEVQYKISKSKNLAKILENEIETEKREESAANEDVCILRAVHAVGQLPKSGR
jgi:hypothetical protein